MTNTKIPKFEKGDEVAYSVQWLASTGQSHSDLSHARGRVVRLVPFGQDGRYLVEIDWDNEDIPNKVLDANLAHVGPNMRFCKC